jgi:hypothetical protein
MTIFAHRCSKCGRLAIWVAELGQWIWPTEPECAHTNETALAYELCYDCQAKEEAFEKVKEQSKERPHTVTVTGTIAGPVEYPAGTTTGDSTFVHIGSTSDGKIWWK